MTNLDRDTILWVLDNLTNYDHECERGARSFGATFRMGSEYVDVKYFSAADIREWLAGELHRTWGQFLPLRVQDDFNYDVTDLKEREIKCSCGWSAKFAIDHVEKNYIEDEKILQQLASDHVRRATEELLEKYQWA